jgi:hypothetical protein
MDFSRPTVSVAILHGLFWQGQRYVADQTIIQQIRRREKTEATDGTLWHWLRTRDRRHATSAL